MWRNIVAKQKPYGGNTLAIYNVFLYKKTTKLNSQSAQYEKKKTKKDHFGKKNHKKNHIKKHCNNSQCFFFKMTKLNS
jgi:hypothetical protein